MKIKSEVFEDLINHAKEGLPIEACGYLFEKNGVFVENRRMTNADKSNEHFSFIPDEQFEALDYVGENNGFSIKGIYHSHPETPARPSKEDIRLAFDPDLVYVIVSLEKEPTVKAFEIKNSQTKEIEIEII